MAIVFPCPCGRELSAPDLAAGLWVRCPRCATLSLVPVVSLARPDPTDSETWRLLVRRALSQNPLVCWGSWGSRRS